MNTNKSHEVTGKKTLKNYYWFYYKWHIFFTLFFGIAIAICITQCATKIDPDCYILFNSNLFISDQQLNETADDLEKYIDDINGDDKIEIVAVNCTYPKGNQTRMAQVNQLAVLQMQSEDTHIWVVDKKGIELYLQNTDIDIFAQYDKFNLFDNKAISVSESKSLNWLNDNNEGNEYYILARKGADGNITSVAKQFIENILK